ncbi:MAG: DUF308 domain-containing protein [Bacteroidota bacterium]|nr:DUF308 domain-containing protein [Bacteroidota bacterium]MDX5447456.1 DUF308 domain-containing protein [Bacteroidota bacterium]
MNVNSSSLTRTVSWIGIFFGILFLFLGYLLFSSGSKKVIDDLVTYFGAALSGLGLSLGYYSYRIRKQGPGGYIPYALFALILFIAGILIIINAPELSGYFNELVGIWAIFFGLLQFVLSTRVKKGKMVFYVSAAVSMILGVVMLLNWAGESGQIPGIYTMVLGALLFLIGIRSRFFNRNRSASTKVSADESTGQG